MAVVDDVRKAMQDFLAPELKSATVRLDAIEKRLDRMEGKLDSLRAEISNDVRSQIDRLVDVFRVNQRLEQLEHRQKRLESKQ